ncbi:MAG TPA: PQQ-binding-like beta-propeller repeat protein [Pirellulaceae bacterium]|nr:PQQ-binding-like beta-propeller repeat protein [Pirellulaceae bacterium]
MATVWPSSMPAARVETPFSNDEFQPDEGWPLVRGNPLNNGVATSSLPEKLEVLWEFTVPNGAFQAAAAIVDVGTQKLVVIADADGRVYALDFEHGQRVWEFNGELGFATTPAYRNGRFYIGDVTGVFYCLNSEGNEVWRFASQQQVDSSANFFDDCVLFGSQDASLYCLRAETGELVWQVETGDQIRCSPTIVGGRAFAAGCDGYLHMIDLQTGQPLDKVDIRSPTGSTPAARDQMIFFGTEQAGFLAVNWEQANIVWEYSADGANSIRGNAAVIEDHVVFATSNRQAISLHPGTGQVNWTTTLRSGSESSPVIVGERVFVPVTGGRLYELRLANGEVVNEWELRGRITASPSVGFGRLILATERGVVVCFGAKD